MDTPETASGPKQMQYGKGDSLDIRVGMTVRASDGQVLGTVTEVAGFGGTHFQDESRAAGEQSVTQALSGTGFFKIDRMAFDGRRDAPAPTVPFHSVQRVTAEDGVVLNEAALGELRTREQSTTARKVEEKQVSKGGWSKRLTFHRKTHNDDPNVKEQESEELREEADTRNQHGPGEPATYIVGRRGVAVAHEPEFSLGGGAEEQSAFDEEMKS